MNLKTAVLGFGNPVRSDDSVGCHIVNQLMPTYADVEHISIFDMGTSAFEILFQLKGHDKIIIVDGVINSEEPDGTIFKLPAEEINAQIQDDPMVFLHGLKWDQALSYAKKIMQDDFPQNEITVYLIAISDTKLEVGMSDPVIQAAKKVIEHIKNDLAQ